MFRAVDLKLVVALLGSGLPVSWGYRLSVLDGGCWLCSDS